MPGGTSLAAGIARSISIQSTQIASSGPMPLAFTPSSNSFLANTLLPVPISRNANRRLAGSESASESVYGISITFGASMVPVTWCALMAGMRSP